MVKVATHFNSFFSDIAGNLVDKLPPITGKYGYDFVKKFYLDKVDQMCSIDDSLLALMRKFRFDKSKNSAAVIIKIDKATRTMILEEEHEDLTLEEIQEELPSSQPRYMIYRYPWKHDDGRESYPMCFIFISPQGCQPEQQMLYAGSMNSLVQKGDFSKVMEVRCVEDLTEEWLLSKLKKMY